MQAYGLLNKVENHWTNLTNCGDVDVCVVEEEHVDGAANADTVLAQSVVVLALRSQYGLLLVGSFRLEKQI